MSRHSKRLALLESEYFNTTNYANVAYDLLTYNMASALGNRAWRVTAKWQL